MRIVVALGGNALLKRGQPMTYDAQRTNVRIAAVALADLARDHQIIVAHGIEQELMNALPPGAECATLLTRVEVDRQDPAFDQPTKPIGPVYTAEEAKLVRAEHLWSMVAEAKGGLRRVVPSPLPQRILGLAAIRLLVDAGVCVICAGGGGIPVIRNDAGGMEGVEAVIDKDRTAALLAQELKADALLMLTDVAAVMRDWGTPEAAAIRTITPDGLDRMTFAAGSMGPKIAAASAFVRAGGAMAGIGTQADARAILEGRAGTLIQMKAAASRAPSARKDSKSHAGQSGSVRA
jgi:carbamate kinase